MNEGVQAALEYAAAGFAVFPIVPRKKNPITKHGLNDASKDEAVIREWWRRYPEANVGIATGEPSGFWVLDLDGDEGQESMRQLEVQNGTRHPPTIRTPNGGLHVYFKLNGADIGNRTKLVHKIDVRGTGGYVVAPPSVLALEDKSLVAYESLRGSIDAITKAMRPAPDWLVDLVTKPKAVAVPPPRPKSPPWETNPPAASRSRIASPAVAERARLYLATCAPAIQGSGGHNSLLWAARAMVVGFLLSDTDALSLLWSDYNPRCMPPWNPGDPAEAKDFERKITEARNTPGTKPAGWLLDECGLRDLAPVTNFDVEGSVKALTASIKDSPAVEVVEEEDDPEEDEDDDSDVPAVPPKMLRMPGFVSEVMDYMLETAPYPNQALAYVGAVTLLALLTSRKVRTIDDIRTNVYMIALAPSRSGKDWPRKVAQRILIECGHTDAIGHDFASAQGLEDALFRAPAKLYFDDEIDRRIQALAQSHQKGDTLHAQMEAILLKLYGESSGIHICRDRSGDEAASTISQPHLTLFGTAVPKTFYGCLTERLVTKGLLGRSIIIEYSGKRVGQDAQVVPVPGHIIDTAKWWHQYSPGGDLASVYPVPAVVPYDREAMQILTEYRNEVDAQYEAFESNQEAERAIWGGAAETARKTALLYACSENHESPVITTAAVQYACDFSRRHAARVAAMFRSHGATSLEDEEARRLERHVRGAPGKRVLHSKLLRFSAMRSDRFGQYIRTLIERGTIEIENVPTRGRIATFYAYRPRRKKKRG